MVPSRTRSLTKSLLLGGHSCLKWVWYELRSRDNHAPTLEVEKDTVREFVMVQGSRLHEKLPLIFGPGVKIDQMDALEATKDALNDPKVDRIYEATFRDHEQNVLVKVDVLERSENSNGLWNLTEVKSSSKINELHWLDLDIQRNVVQNTIELNQLQLAILNKDFVYDPPTGYKDIFKIYTFPPGNDLEEEEEDKTASKTTTTKRNKKKKKKTKAAKFQPIDYNWLVGRVGNFVNDFDLENSPPPEPEVGNHCKTCLYQMDCHDKKNKSRPKDHIPLSIIPMIGKKLEEQYGELYEDLRVFPRHLLEREHHKVIYDAHVENKEWRSKTLAKFVQSLPWPRYFMDFETSQQIFPTIPGTTSREPIPFLWCVHKWRSFDQQLTVDDAEFFIGYDEPDIHLKFANSLLECLGEDPEAPIFVHSVSAERTILQKLAQHPSCAHLKPEIDHICQKRMLDTLEISKKHFYSPMQMGSYSLKNIVKALPQTEVTYTSQDKEFNSGTDAQLGWYQIVDGLDETRKQQLQKELVDYCSRDSLAMVDMIRYYQKQ